MSNSKEYKAQFENILTKSSWWSRLRGSQFIEMIATFVGQMVYKSRAAAERNLQEGFLSTAIKRSSILAAAEDKGYVGRRISPSTGRVEVNNLSNSFVSLPVNAPLISNSALAYVTKSAIEIPAHGTVEVDISQLSLRVFKAIIEQEEKFQTVLLSKAVTAKVHKLDVYVSSETGGAELWEKRYMFRRATARSKVYDEFYKPTEQLGIRFGNGVHGKIPEEDSEITLQAWLTEGDTTLINEQPLELTGDVAYLNDYLTIKTVTPIVGGASAESEEETRSGALYVTPFDEQIVWDDDYSHYIRRNLAHITWVNAWGEQEQEQQDGKADLDNINRIFISSYSSTLSQDELNRSITELLVSTNYLNKRYRFVEANLRPFTIALTGTVTGEKDILQVKKVIQEAVDAAYGKDPKGERPSSDTSSVAAYGQGASYGGNEKVRADEIKEKDVNKLIRELGLFYDFSINWSGYPSNIKLEDYVFIDIEASTLDIRYVG